MSVKANSRRPFGSPTRASALTKRKRRPMYGKPPGRWASAARFGLMPGRTRRGRGVRRARRLSTNAPKLQMEDNDQIEVFVQQVGGC